MTMKTNSVISETIFLRDATPGDAKALAELINFAGEGLPLYLWEKMAQAGESGWNVGCQRAQREKGSFSYRNATVALAGGQVVANLIGYPIGDTAEEIGPDMPAMFVPLQELENEALSSWYINVLATYPAFRGRGIGSNLLEQTERQARQNGLDEISLIVSDGNHGAIRFYQHHGFSLRASRQMVKEDWNCTGENWLLMIKQL